MCVKNEVYEVMLDDALSLYTKLSDLDRVEQRKLNAAIPFKVKVTLSPTKRINKKNIKEIIMTYATKKSISEIINLIPKHVDVRITMYTSSMTCDKSFENNNLRCGDTLICADGIVRMPSYKEHYGDPDGGGFDVFFVMEDELLITERNKNINIHDVKCIMVYEIDGSLQFYDLDFNHLETGWLATSETALENPEEVVDQKVYEIEYTGPKIYLKEV